MFKKRGKIYISMTKTYVSEEREKKGMNERRRKKEKRIKGMKKEKKKKVVG